MAITPGLAVQVVDRHAARDRRALQPFGMAKRQSASSLCGLGRQATW